MLVGAPDTPYTAVMLQVHYLLPRGVTAADLRRAQYRDSSGVALRLAPPRRPVGLGTIAFINTTLRLRPAPGIQEVVARCDAACLDNVLGGDFAGPEAAAGGGLTLVAAHLHAHAFAKRMALVHFSSDGTRTEMLTLNPFCGYGNCQEFHRLPPTLPKVRRGDTLQLTCAFENPTGRTVVEGTSHGDEMCGPVLFYAPHDPKRNAGANIVFLGKWDRRRRAT